MKKIILLISLLFISNLIAEPMFNGIEVNRKNSAHHGFHIEITENEYQKNCYNIKIKSTIKDNEKFNFGYGQVLINKDKKSILNIRPNIRMKDGKKYFHFLIDKEEFKNLKINIIYLEPNEPVHDPKTNSITFVACGAENTYQIKLTDFVKQ